MADNYLEKQREKYEERKAAWLKSQKFKKKKRPVVPDINKAEAREAERVNTKD